MKARDLLVVMAVLAGAAFYQVALAPAPPDSFAARRPFLAKVMTLAKWVGIGIVLHGDEAPPAEEEPAPQLYNDDAYQQHMVHNRTPMRAVGGDGEVLIDHCHGY